MPGWYIHMDVARKALAGLVGNKLAAGTFNNSAGSAGPNAQWVSDVARANPAYVALGAIGPDIFFLLPDFKPPVGNMLWKMATCIRDLYTAWDDTFIGPYESAMGPVGYQLADEENALTGGLENTISTISSEAMKILTDFVLTLILQQYDFFGLLSSAVPSGFDEQTFFWSDMLHYRETYRFGAELWKRASAEPDPVLQGRFRAFALGWMSHLATDVTGHSFVNEKVGGPYRLHWDRHHLVENHMDALVYNTDHGGQSIYQQMSNSALHLWLAFKPDGSSRVNMFDPEPNLPYPNGDSSIDIFKRNLVWDVDSNLPDELAQFISDTMKAVFTPSLSAPATGMVACCPTIISTLDSRVPIATGGYPEKDDIIGTYWWLYKYVKWLTTDYYKIRRPDPPPVVVIPSFPQTPGAINFDPGPGASGSWHNTLDFLFSLHAWITWLKEIIIWPAAVIAGIVAGTLTYPLRWALYEAIELPLYNAWLGIHTYLAITGYVVPMPGEVNAGLHTLGVSVDDNWAETVVALGLLDGGLTPTTISPNPSGQPTTPFPKDVVLDPPTFITSIFSQLFHIGAPAVNGEFPSEFTRPWRWPDTDNQGNPINIEQPQNFAGPFTAGQNATAFFGLSPGDVGARTAFEGAINETQTIAAATTFLPQGKHLGDPMDYTAWVVANLTRDGIDTSKLANFNLDSDRGYGYLTWDWVRDHSLSPVKAMPSGFKGNGDPSAPGNAPTNISQHVYPAPVKPGYGWNTSEQIATVGQPPIAGFDPGDPTASVRIRYIDQEVK
jgi:hypothetical protein